MPEFKGKKHLILPSLQPWIKWTELVIISIDCKVLHFKTGGNLFELIGSFINWTGKLNLSINVIVIQTFPLTADGSVDLLLVCACAGRSQCYTREDSPTPLLGRWWVVMSTSLFSMGWRRLLDLQPQGQVTVWGHCVGSKCWRNGLKRLSSEGDMSGHASLKKKEKNRERLESLMWAIPLGFVKKLSA